MIGNQNTLVVYCWSTVGPDGIQSSSITRLRTRYVWIIYVQPCQWVPYWLASTAGDSIACAVGSTSTGSGIRTSGIIGVTSGVCLTTSISSRALICEYSAEVHRMARTRSLAYLSDPGNQTRSAPCYRRRWQDWHNYNTPEVSFC